MNEDIINLPHHISTKHPQMSLQDRAAQFSPFAALTGYEAAVKETARLTDRRIELDEGEKEKINLQLQQIRENLAEGPEATFVYFVPDPRKEGGSYVTVTGRVLGIDEFKREILLQDGQIVPIDELFAVER